MGRMSHEPKREVICGIIVHGKSGKIDGHACFEKKPCPIHKSQSEPKSDCCGAEINGTLDKWCSDCRGWIIPASEKEVKHYSDCAVHNEPALLVGSCNCGGYSTETPDWMEEFDEKFPYLWMRVGKEESETDRSEEIKSFIAETIKQEVEQGATRSELVRIRIAEREQGRQEEKARIVKMIEKDGVPTKHHNQSAEFRRGYSTSLDDLLNNLKKDE